MIYIFVYFIIACFLLSESQFYHIFTVTIASLYDCWWILILKINILKSKLKST